jgi:hypothetical protein
MPEHRLPSQSMSRCPCQQHPTLAEQTQQHKQRANERAEARAKAASDEEWLERTTDCDSTTKANLLAYCNHKGILNPHTNMPFPASTTRPKLVAAIKEQHAPTDELEQDPVQVVMQAGDAFTDLQQEGKQTGPIDELVIDALALCCAVLCCAVLCCAVLCCAVLPGLMLPRLPQAVLPGLMLPAHQLLQAVPPGLMLPGQQLL